MRLALLDSTWNELPSGYAGASIGLNATLPWFLDCYLAVFVPVGDSPLDQKLFLLCGRTWVQAITVGQEKTISDDGRPQVHYFCVAHSQIGARTVS